MTDQDTQHEVLDEREPDRRLQVTLTAKVVEDGLIVETRTKDAQVQVGQAMYDLIGALIADIYELSEIHGIEYADDHSDETGQVAHVRTTADE